MEHHGVDLTVFHPGSRLEARRRLGLPADAVVLMFAGRVQPLKAPHLVLAAQLSELGQFKAPFDHDVTVGQPDTLDENCASFCDPGKLLPVLRDNQFTSLVDSNYQFVKATRLIF